MFENITPRHVRKARSFAWLLYKCADTTMIKTHLLHLYNHAWKAAIQSKSSCNTTVSSKALSVLPSLRWASGTSSTATTLLRHINRYPVVVIIVAIRVPWTNIFIFARPRRCSSRTAICSRAGNMIRRNEVCLFKFVWRSPGSYDPSAHRTTQTSSPRPTSTFSKPVQPW